MENTLQTHADRLAEYQPENYKRKLSLVGARTVFTTRVYQLSTTGESSFEANISSKLMKNFNRDLCGVLEELQRWAHNKNTSVWMSDTLSADLNLPMTKDNPLPDYSSLPILFLGERRHFFVLTVVDVSNKPRKVHKDVLAEMRKYSIEMGQLLTSALYNFCHCDFVLLPCTIALSGKFVMKDFERELLEQMAIVSPFYDGPEIVTPDMYSQLKAAVSAVAGVTYFPCFLQEPENMKAWLLLLDSEWKNLLSLFIEAMVHQEAESLVTFTQQTEFKVKVAVLEAARRLSFTRKVVIITSDDNVAPSTQRLITEAEMEDQRTPDLTVLTPAEITPSADHYVNIGQDSIHFRCGVFRCLLLGSVGCGKSATGNTILGKNVFKQDFSLGPVTRQCEAGTTLIEDRGMRVEIIDTPGLFSGRNRSSSVWGEICEKVSTVDAGLDAVLYVIRIDMYTEQEIQMYLNIKAMLGDGVLNHTVVIFTFGDMLAGKSIEDLLKTDGRNLKKVLHSCKNRYVVFDNKGQNKQTQLELLMDVVKQMKNGNRNKPYLCPKYTKEQRAHRHETHVQGILREMRQELTRG